MIDLLDIEDSWTAVKVKFDVVKKDLLSQVMSKEIVKDEKYECYNQNRPLMMVWYLPAKHNGS